MSLSWLSVPAGLYGYYLGVVAPIAWVAVRLLNDEDESKAATTKKAGKKAAGPSFPLDQKSPKSLLTILVLILISIPFYLPIFYLLRADKDLPKEEQAHVVARFFTGAVSAFMNFRIIQLIIFTPISVRREWSLVRLFIECTSLVLPVESNDSKNRKKKDDDEEEEEEADRKQRNREKKPVKPLATWGDVLGFFGLYLASTIVKVILLLVILWLFRDTDARTHETLPSVNEIAGAVPNLFLGLPSLGYREIRWADFLYFFAYHAAHGVAFFLMLSAFSDFGASICAVLLGPNLKERVVDMWNAPLLATSPRDFWGRRWNLLFRTIFHQLLFAPIALYIDPVLALLDMQTGTKKKKRVPTHLVKKTSFINPHRASPEGRLIAATTVFFFSGVLHEWVNYITFGEYTMENLAFFLVQAAACAIQTQIIQSYPTWKMGKFSSTPERVAYWALNSLFMIVTAPLFFAPFHRNNFFPRVRSLFI